MQEIDGKLDVLPVQTRLEAVQRTAPQAVAEAEHSVGKQIVKGSEAKSTESARACSGDSSATSSAAKKRRKKSNGDSSEQVHKEDRE